MAGVGGKPRGRRGWVVVTEAAWSPGDRRDWLSSLVCKL